MKCDYSKELDGGLSPLTATLEASRCLLCLDAPCSKMCPAGTDPAKFIRSVRFRNIKGAAETIRENNPLGSICARVCPTEKYCEKGCSRSGIDRPIDIGGIQRFVTDYEESLGMEILKAGEPNGHKVAFVGSGPASLACATMLRRRGYEVEVFEKEKVLGGALRLIPEYRLPDEVIDKEIKRIEKLGVKFHLGKEVGKDISLDELKSKFDAVVVGAGFSKGKFLDVFKGGSNVILAVDFLKEAKAKKGDIKLPENVIVVGGGDVAMDVNSTLKILGVPHVTDLVYEEFAEFRASKEEKEIAHSLGVTIMDGYIPVEAKGNEYLFKHRKIESEVRIKADLVILATGQTSDIENLGLKMKGPEVDYGEPFLTDDKKVFVIGDVAHNPYDKTVVGAVRTGKEAAERIDRMLKGE